MTRRDIVIGLIILVLLGGVIFYRQKQRSSEEEMRVPETLSSVRKISRKNLISEFRRIWIKQSLKTFQGQGHRRLPPESLITGSLMQVSWQIFQTQPPALFK